MIKRIVKMKFRKDAIEEFKRLFESAKYKIAAFEDCHHLELIQDINDPSIIFTVSIWTNEKGLNKYRDSVLFEKTWRKTKLLFDGKPAAWSTKQISIVDQEGKS